MPESGLAEIETDKTAVLEVVPSVVAVVLVVVVTATELLKPPDESLPEMEVPLWKFKLNVWPPFEFVVTVVSWVP